MQYVKKCNNALIDPDELKAHIKTQAEVAMTLKRLLAVWLNSAIAILFMSFLMIRNLESEWWHLAILLSLFAVNIMLFMSPADRIKQEEENHKALKIKDGLQFTMWISSVVLISWFYDWIDQLFGQSTQVAVSIVLWSLIWLYWPYKAWGLYQIYKNGVISIPSDSGS